LAVYFTFCTHHVRSRYISVAMASKRRDWRPKNRGSNAGRWQTFIPSPKYQNQVWGPNSSHSIGILVPFPRG